MQCPNGSNCLLLLLPLDSPKFGVGGFSMNLGVTFLSLPLLAWINPSIIDILPHYRLTTASSVHFTYLILMVYGVHQTLGITTMHAAGDTTSQSLFLEGSPASWILYLLLAYFWFCLVDQDLVFL
jgi:hypothetical protein